METWLGRVVMGTWGAARRVLDVLMKKDGGKLTALLLLL